MSLHSLLCTCRANRSRLGTTVEATAVRFCEEFVRTETPPVPESYASMSVEDRIDFIAQNILREYNSK